MKSISNININKTDKVIWVIYIILLLISAMEVFSAMGKKVAQNSFVPTLLTHIIWIIIGFGVCFIFSKIQFKKLGSIAKWILILAIALTIIPYIQAGLDSKLSLTEARWIRIPNIKRISFQPSEFLKWAMILYLAATMSIKNIDIRSKETFYRLIIPLLIGTILVFISNFSTSMIIMFIGLTLMLIYGCNKKLLLKTGLIFAVVVGILLLIAVFVPDSVQGIGRLSTAISRIINFGETNYADITQPNQARMAVATGGLLGRGIGNSVQSRFLAEGHNDFIFSIILEEGGIWLSGLIILFYIILLYRIFKIARNTQSTFGSILSCAIGIAITLQTLINMSVSVGIIPVTGQTLPFISYGGTSLVFTSMALGIVLNISKSIEPVNSTKTEIQQEEIAENKTSFHETLSKKEKNDL